ncbi:unnamed protein product [Periconia digitata]|uniref:Uncharacterized protein n=1 Tax=Periconia digitata TaxID=1303443 RepID=A0A9W4UF49_9PLEO|nr:unnamed protein product [Periconia digitata]
MRFPFVASLLVAAVAATSTDSLDPPGDHERAKEVTLVREGESYIVKLDCPGCPLNKGMTVEKEKEWRGVMGEDALILNITLSPCKRSLTLASTPLYPLPAGNPPTYRVIQTLSSLSPHALDTIAPLVAPPTRSQEWFNYVDLAYTHRILATPNAGQFILQLDVTGVVYREHNTSSLKLYNFPTEADERKVIEILVSQHLEDRHIKPHISSIALLPPSHVKPPLKMKCGRPAARITSFNPLEWDSFGKLGSAARTWNVFWTRMAAFFMGPGLLCMFVTAGVGAVLLVRRRVVEARAEKGWDEVGVDGDEGVVLLMGGEEGLYVDEEDEDEEEGLDFEGKLESV